MGFYPEEPFECRFFWARLACFCLALSSLPQSKPLPQSSAAWCCEAREEKHRALSTPPQASCPLKKFVSRPKP